MMYASFYRINKILVLLSFSILDPSILTLTVWRWIAVLEEMINHPLHLKDVDLAWYSIRTFRVDLPVADNILWGKYFSSIYSLGIEN